MEGEKPSKESGKSSSELRRERRARRWRKRDSSGEQYTGHNLVPPFMATIIWCLSATYQGFIRWRGG